MFKKWWGILIQGILMFILGILIFRNPGEVLAGLSLWFGIIVILTGLSGIFGWLFAGSEHREGGSLLWSLVTLIFGIIILMNLAAAMKVITIIFGIWVLFAGFSLLSSGWSIKSSSVVGWILVIVGILSVLAGLAMIFNIGSGAAGVSFILGAQVTLVGIALILYSFVKKAVVSKLKESIGA